MVADTVFNCFGFFRDICQFCRQQFCYAVNLCVVLKRGNKMKKKNKISENSRLLFDYMIENKKWWLIPFLAVVIFFALFIVFGGNSSVMPLIYALF